MHTKKGEIHPWLSKVESIFFPYKNRINRVNYLFFIAKYFLIIIILAQAITPLDYKELFNMMLHTNSMGLKIFDFAILSYSAIIFGMIFFITFYMPMRAQYYRLQDFDVNGNWAYVFFVAGIIVNLSSPYIMGNLANSVNTQVLHYIKLFLDYLPAAFTLALLLIPGTNGSNRFS